MSGQRIDDHSFWAGSKGKASVFPDGPHKERMTSSAEAAGDVSVYLDTDERIKATQNEKNKKARSLPMKTGYRN